MGLLELCEKYYNTTNLYEVLQIPKKATDKEVRKAYYKLSLKIHPDRVPEDQKLEATEKFKILSGVHAVLTDKKKRTNYDETKTLDDDDSAFDMDCHWTDYWKLIFKKITDEDIKTYEKEYIGSKEEKDDLKHAYLTGKGNMDYIVDHVQFARSEHEPRLKQVINEMIESGEVPAYKAFTHETDKKRLRRAAKENKEAEEAEELKNELGLGSGSSDLESIIKQRQGSRAKQFDSIIDNLAEKYGGKEKSKGTKRKSTPKGKTTTKSKRSRT